MKRFQQAGFTIVELIISMSLFAVIILAVMTLFVVVLKNYQTQSQKSFFQKELNFAIDNIDKDIKSALSVEANHDIHSSGDYTLVLALPATENDGSFVYTANVVEKDYIVYYISGSQLKKRIYANNLGTRTNGDYDILNDVSTSEPIFNYLPNIASTEQVNTKITLSKNLGKDVSVTAERLATMRNKE